MRQENKSKNDIDLLMEVGNVVSMLMSKFSGYPELYSTISDSLILLKEDFGFEEPEDSSIAKTLKNTSWDTGATELAN